MVVPVLNKTPDEIPPAVALALPPAQTESPAQTKAPIIIIKKRTYATHTGIEYAGDVIKEFANREPTNLNNCNSACDIYDTCKGFTYNDAQTTCWLKSDLKNPVGASDRNTSYYTQLNLPLPTPMEKYKQELIPVSEYIDISKVFHRPFTIPPVVAYKNTESGLSYTFSFDIIIEKITNNWRNIMHHGTTDNRQPGIYIIGGTELGNANRIHVSFHPVHMWLDSTHASALQVNEKYTVTVVINENTIYIYIDGVLNNQGSFQATHVGPRILKWETSVTNKWHWNDQWNNPPNGFIKISNVNWWNIALSDEEVLAFYKTVPSKHPQKEQIQGKYAVKLNTDYPDTDNNIGKPVISTKLEDCSTKCNDLTGCIGYVTDKTNQCWFKKKLANEHTDNNRESYILY